MENPGETVARRKSPTKTKWFNFRVLSPTSAILRGSYSMTDKHFKFQSRGKQGTATAVMAIVLGSICEAKMWTKSDVDGVLEAGDKLYRTSQTRNKIDPSTYMTTDMIYPEFFFKDYKCLISTESKNVYGNVFAESVGCPDFSDGLTRFFRTENCCVVTAQGASVGIWQSTNIGYFYFDGAPCSGSGDRCSDGVACLIHFKSLEPLRDLFLRNLNRRQDSRYCIDKIAILRVTRINRWPAFSPKSPEPVRRSEKAIDCTEALSKPDKPLSIVINKEPVVITLSNYSLDRKFAAIPLINQNAFDTGYPYKDLEVNIPSTFKALSKGISVLHGWTHESSEMYKGKGAQNVANCLMAIAMKALNDPRAWLRETLDQVLTLGDALHAETKLAKPNLKSLTAADFNETRVKIEGKRMFVSVDLMTAVGTLNSKSPSVLNLKQALEEFFAEHTEGVLETSSVAVAVWTLGDGYFYSFDPRECDIAGVRVVEEKKSGKGGKEGKDVATVKVKGKCCVLRFSDVDDLVGHFLGNVSPLKKNDRFTLRHVSVVEELPGVRPWFEFKPEEAGRTWVLRGTLTSDSEELEEAKATGMALPVAVLITASEIPPHVWTPETVDDVLQEGNEYFAWCIPPEREDDRDLTLERLKKVLFVKGRRVQVKVEDSVLVQKLQLESLLEDNLVEGISEFFRTKQFGILQLGDVLVPVWRFEEELKDKTKVMGYYCFNLTSDNAGDLEETAAGRVIRAVNPAEIARVIAARIDPDAEGTEFFIHGFEVLGIGEILSPEDLENEMKAPIMPELNSYREVDDGACINGSFDQADVTIFKQKTRDKQQAANALTALAMRQFYNPHLWYQEVVDDILKLGDQLTFVNLGNLEVGEEEEGGEEMIRRDYLRPSEIEDTFSIGVNKFSLNLEEEKMKSPPSELPQVLEEFFNENSMGIVRQGRVMLPIWQEGDVFFTMDPRSRQDDPKSTASVSWFLSIPSLSSSLLQSIQNPNEELLIDGVELENEFASRIAEETDAVTEDQWHGFLKKREDLWELSGPLSITDEKFPEDMRGKQTPGIAVVATIFSKIYEPQHWTPEIIEEVVVTGNKLYEKSAARLGEGENPGVNDIITEFFLSNRRINLMISDCVQAGAIFKGDPKVPDLASGVEKFFQDHQCGVLTLQNSTHIPLWKYKEYFYYLLPLNNVSVLRFTSPESLSSHLVEMFPEGDFEISGVEVVDWNKLPPWKHDPSVAVRPKNLPPLNAFKPLEGDARAILSGSTHQGSEIFPWGIRDKQTSANCVVALGMGVIKDPITWTKKILDEILVVGTSLHEESVKFGGREGRLRAEEVVRIFHIGKNVLTADVEVETVKGQVALPPPEPEVKGKGKAKKKPPKPKKKKGKQKRAPPPPPPVIFLEEGLGKFFEGNRAGVLTTGNYSVALWRDQGVFFMFDPRSRDNRGLVADSGTACVMWFACLEPLYDVILANLEGEEKFGLYRINRVIVRRNLIEGLPAPAFDCSMTPGLLGSENIASREFNPLDEEVSVLLGNISMFQRGLHSRGFQSTAIAVVAIVMAGLHVPSTWTPAIVDSIVRAGDELHRDSERSARAGARCLSPSELLTCFVVGDTKARVSIHQHTAAGIVQVQDLTEALGLFFRHHCTGILHTPNFAVAVMQHCGKFYLVDAAVRNSQGRPDYSGGACVIRCERIVRIARAFVSNCNYKVPSVYTLNAVDILDLKFLASEQSCASGC
ncbi:uncharacterized protein [Fopius arisanus]|uniref:Uncharacterized protein n=2 Tax=Fopius arisanus TaxID=64838 RepID=A0A9R1U385_9HYME|nr:PREDICTED: uncharacterized protein LOC105268009 [Fopius arisanus]